MTQTTSLHRRALIVGAAAACSAAFTGVASARKRVGLELAPDDATMELIAAREWAAWKEALPISTSAATSARVTAVGQKITTAAGLRRQSWEFVVFDDAEIYAFALVGGRVGVFTGLLDYVENDDQLAFAIGHEVGHIVKRHHAEQLGLQLGAQLGMNVAAAGNLGAGTSMGPVALQRVLRLGNDVGVLYPHSREQEAEADQIGVDLMHKAGFQPLQAARYWERISGAVVQNNDALFMEHPQNADRMASILQYIQRKRYDRL